MTFITEEELKKKNQLIKNYLDNKKVLKQRLQQQILAKQQLQENASKIFTPITKKIDEKQDKLIENIQNQLAIEPKPKSTFTVDFERGFTEEEKELLKQHEFETDLATLVQNGPEFINGLRDRARGINHRLGGYRRRRDGDVDLIDEQIRTFKKYRDKLNK